MKQDSALKPEADAVSALLEEDKTGSSCATGKCPFSSPKVMSFVLPFFAVLAVEQWAASSNTCLTSAVCQMCEVSKAALAVAAGMIGLAVQKFLAKR